MAPQASAPPSVIPGAQIPAVVGSWTQTRPPAGRISGCVKTVSTGDSAVHSDTMAPAAALPSATNMATGGGAERSIHVTFVGDTGHEYQHKPQLW